MDVVVRPAAGTDRLDEAGYRIGNLAEGLLAQKVRDKIVDGRSRQGVLGSQQLREGRSQLLKAAYLEMVHDQAKVENFFAEQIFKNDAH